SDMTYQILAAQNFLEGHGISSATILSSDLSMIVYDPVVKWPPGFTLLFTPLYVLFSKDYIMAALALGIICSTLLIFASRSILKILGTPYYLINLYTLLSGFFGYYFYTKPFTDAIAITFFIIAIYYTLLLLKTHERLLRNVVFLSTSLILCGFIKYMFIPAIFLIPGFLFIKGLTRKEPWLKKAGLISFMSLLLVFGALFIYQAGIHGSIAYIKEPGRGFFPENLGSSFPFITASFIKPDSLQQLPLFPAGSNAFLFHVYQVTSFAIFLIIIFYCLRRMIRPGHTKRSATEDFFHLSLLVSATLVILLILLSLRVAKEPLDDGMSWTYVEEPRYYGLLNVLIHIAVFASYPFYKTAKSKLGRLLLPALVLFMLPEMFRGIAFTAHRIQWFNKEIYGWQYELQFQKNVKEIVAKTELIERDRNIILTGTSDWMTLRASLYCHLPVFEDVSKLNTISELKTTKPVTLLAIIKDNDMNAYKSFISLDGVKQEGQANGFSFYTYNLHP
ncbi:MAG TPA: hypothetical protein VIV35_04780, partial [Chitinophagaceae bacterium]